MYVRNAWYCVGFWDMLDNGGMIDLTVLDTPLVVYRKESGALVALDNRCAHRLAALSKGRREGDGLRCMYHGILFDETGRATEIPGQDIIPKTACVRRYAVTEESGWVWVWMGQYDEADRSLLPPVHGLRNPEWRMPKAYLDYAADYRLINDNLTDLSHISFVHPASFGPGADGSWSDGSAVISPIDRGVRADRWLVGTSPLPPLGKAAAYEKVDQWIRVDYFVPGIFSLTGHIFPPGTAEQFGHGEPDASLSLFTHYSQQAVTPTGPCRSRYFYAWGPKASMSTPEEGVLMGSILQAAFDEDKELIERQQQMIDIDPGHPIMPIAADKGVVLFQRLMKRLMQEEEGLPSQQLGAV